MWEDVLSNNTVVEQVHKDIQKRGVPTGDHVIKDITQYGISHKGFAEASKVEFVWFDKLLQVGKELPQKFSVIVMLFPG